jgi:hypothetical protein
MRCPLVGNAELLATLGPRYRTQQRFSLDRNPIQYFQSKGAFIIQPVHLS